jgi:hypothetical protein
LARYGGHPALGRLLQPRSYNSVTAIARTGRPWGADNDALAGVNPDAYLRMLDAIARSPCDQLKFVVAPDAVQRTPDGIVGLWEGTLWLWRCWRPALVARGLPPAIVLQNPFLRCSVRAPVSEAGAKRYRLVLLYLAAIVLAKLLVSHYGPAMSVFNA